MNSEIENEIIAETENLIAWRSKEESIGYVYHIELGAVTLHLMPEEWDELSLLIQAIRS
jgi:hypothetical protein